MQLGDVIKVARDLGKMPSNTCKTYRALTLDKWAEEAEKATKAEVIEDKNDLNAAFLSISDRYPDVKGQLDLVQV